VCWRVSILLRLSRSMARAWADADWRTVWPDLQRTSWDGCVTCQQRFCSGGRVERAYFDGGLSGAMSVREVFPTARRKPLRGGCDTLPPENRRLATFWPKARRKSGNWGGAGFCGRELDRDCRHWKGTGAGLPLSWPYDSVDTQVRFLDEVVSSRFPLINVDAMCVDPRGAGVWHRLALWDAQGNWRRCSTRGFVFRFGTTA